MSDLLPKLVQCYGQDRVVDVFKGTGLEGPAKQFGFAGHLVRAVLPQAQVTRWHNDMHKLLQDLAF